MCQLSMSLADAEILFWSDVSDIHHSGISNPSAEVIEDSHNTYERGCIDTSSYAYDLFIPFMHAVRFW